MQSVQVLDMVVSKPANVSLGSCTKSLYATDESLQSTSETKKTKKTKNNHSNIMGGNGNCYGAKQDSYLTMLKSLNFNNVRTRLELCEPKDLRGDVNYDDVNYHEGNEGYSSS